MLKYLFNLLFLATALTFVLTTLPGETITAQSYGTLRGFVTDSTNGEVLAYGNVYLKELQTGASTDDRGYFYINRIPANKTYTLIVSFVGFESKSIEAFIAPNKITQVDVQLVPSSVEMETIEKVAEKVIEKNETDIGLQRIDVRQLEALPKGVETDVFRSLQFLPGVQSTGDVSAKYYVRGGASNQNLVLLNGATVYNPFHALGLFSVIDPEMINNIEFYKGGFTAEYGTRLSSVLKIVTKDGNKNKFGGKASSSYLSGKVLVEGPIPNGSFIFTGRRSYKNDILKKFLNDQNIPIDFYDASFKLNYSSPSLLKNGKFIFFGFLSKDKLDNNDPFQEDFSWSNDLFGFQWQQVYDSPLYSTLSLSYSKFTGAVDPNLSDSQPRSNELKDVSVGIDFTYIYNSKDELSLGAKIKSIDSKLYFQNQTGAITDIGEFAGNLSIYGKFKLMRFENFGADIGTRVNVFALNPNGEFYLEPRVSLTYRIHPLIGLKAAWGKYQQELTTISNENEVISLFEPWIITPEYLDPARSTHYIAGVEVDFTENLNFSFEGYYKTIDNLSEINENKEITSDPDLVLGTGESYGYEFLVNYNTAKLRTSVSYSLSWAYKELDNWVYYPKYDSRHSVSLLADYKLGAGWSISAIWNYNSGLPFTELIGFYDRLNVGNGIYPLFNDLAISPYTILGDRNLGRLPDYHRLDLSLSKKFSLAFVNFYVDVSVLNVYDRQNIFYFKRDTGERVNMLPFMPTATVKIEI